LAISPVDPTILASASTDDSIRIWTLDPTYEQQPTTAIAFGEGHEEPVLTLVRASYIALSRSHICRVSTVKVNIFSPEARIRG
jgi:hypothetical protein